MTTPSRGRLGEYALWQAWDFVRERGLMILIVGVLIGWQIVRATSATGMGMLHEMVFTQMLMSTIPLMVLLSISRMVSADRTAGTYRLLFAKPISISLFYAQRFVVTLAGLLACIAVLCGVAVLNQIAVPVLSILAYVAIVYIAFGGIGFLLSVLTRFDWTGLLVLWYGSEALHLWSEHEQFSWRAALNVLPPAHFVEPVRGALIASRMPPTEALAWLLGYGAICVIAGVLILERRQLSS